MATIRTAIIAGNWKMNHGPNLATLFAQEIVPELEQLVSQHEHIMCILCPPAISLAAVRQVLDAQPVSQVELGAQNMYFEDKGAFTGELSPTMVGELCSTVILGHSERRTIFGENDELVNRKTLAALHNHLRPIVCVGENDAQHEAHETEEVIRRQVQHSLANLPSQHVRDIVIAYEPIWAIPAKLPLSRERGRSFIRYANSMAICTALMQPQPCASSMVVASPLTTSRSS